MDRASVNSNLHSFATISLTDKMKLIDDSYFVLKNGMYSGIMSTTGLSIEDNL